jgi:hypothetical protein
LKKYGFIYIWYDRKHKRYYIGMHWGREDDGYICSSPWMLKSFTHRPRDFKRRILERIYTNRKDLYERELYWLNMIKDEELGKKYYNLNKFVQEQWWLDEEKSLSVKEKISKTCKEKFNNPEHRQKYLEGLKKRKSLKGMPGRRWTEEQKLAKSIEKKGKKRAGSSENWKHTAKTKELISMKNSGKVSPMKGKSHTLDSKLLMSESRKDNKNRLGKSHSIESKQLMSQNRKGYIWYNNGINEMLLKSIDIIPTGYIKGRITKFKEKGKWYYNPITLEKKQFITPPGNWLPGMKP